MEIPSEEEIEAVISEFANGPDHPNEELDHCEACQMQAEFNRRCREGENLCVLDSLFARGITNTPEFAVSLLVFDKDAIREFSKLVRTAFFLGYKTGINHEQQKEIEKLLGE